MGSLSLSAASAPAAAAASGFVLNVNSATAVSVTYGNENSLVFAITGGPALGSVTVETTPGSKSLCTASLSLFGAGHCSPTTATVLAASASPYSVVASYTQLLGGPVTSSSVNVTVNQQTTTTSLSISPSPTTSVVYGQESTLTFDTGVTPEIEGSSPTGTVDVDAGTTLLCAVTLPATSCATTDDPLAASGTAYALTATYVGNTNFATSTSSPLNLTVDQATTSTTLSLAPTTVTFGAESTLQVTSTVAPEFSGSPQPTGTVTIAAAGLSPPLCIITLPATSCSPTNNAVLPVGSSYQVTAAYSGDANYQASTSDIELLTVTAGNSSTSLTLSPTTVTYGNEAVASFGATVTSPDSSAPTGIVTVETTGTNTTTLCSFTLSSSDNGQGSCSPTSATVLDASTSPYSVVASYNGGGGISASSSNPQDFTVEQAGTQTSISPPSASVAYGNEGTVSFSATVTSLVSGSPTGTVMVENGSTPLCSFTLVQSDNGSGSCLVDSNTALPASGTGYLVNAHYAGDTNFGGSTTTSPSTLTVTKASSSVTISPTTLTYGQEGAVALSANVGPELAGSSPTGSVTFQSGSTPLCTFTLSASDDGSGSCFLTSDTLLPGSATAYPVTATYAGDTNFGGTTTTTPGVLTVSQATSTTALTLSKNSVAFGNEKSVQFDVTVTPQFSGTPTGLVTVKTGTTQLCTFTLTSSDSGQGSCSPTSNTLLPGSATAYPVVATYAGDTNFGNSATTPSSPNDLTVAAGTSTTTLTPASATVTYGAESAVSFTATVMTSTLTPPTSTVTVATTGAGATTLCQISTLTQIDTDSWQGSCSPTSDTILDASGSAYQVVASYPGDAFVASSTSSPSSLTVNQTTTASSLTLSPASATYGNESSVTADVTVSSAAPGAPTGTVTVAAGGTTFCSFTLVPSDNGTGSCNSSPTAFNAGSYTLTASYGGDTNFASSASSSQGLTVNPRTATTPTISNLPSGAAERGSFVASVATDGDGVRTVSSSTPGNCTVAGDGLTVSFKIQGTCTLTPQVSSGTNYIGATGPAQSFNILTGPRGYWLVGTDGGIFSFGTAQFHGSMGGTTLQRPVVGITPTQSRSGYWLVASDGGLFAFGDANYFGSVPGLGLHPAGSGLPNSLAAPIVAMVPSTTGLGYFMVASDGGVFAFGDARFAGSCPGIGGCVGSAVAVMPDASGNGYWLVTSSGSIYAFGDAPFFGAPPAQSAPVTSAVATPDGQGYWILYANGAVANFGDAAAYGNPAGYVNFYNPATAIFPTSDGLGYWVAAAKGDVFTYGNAPFLGSMSSTPLNGSIIAAYGF